MTATVTRLRWQTSPSLNATRLSDAITRAFCQKNKLPEVGNAD